MLSLTLFSMSNSIEAFYYIGEVQPIFCKDCANQEQSIKLACNLCRSAVNLMCKDNKKIILNNVVLNNVVKNL